MRTIPGRAGTAGMQGASSLGRAVGVVALLAVLALSATRGGAEESRPGFAPRQGAPNIVLILADDLGYGDLGCYGQKQIQTPNLDRLAAEGMRFTQFYAGSTVCAPSRCVLMTGKHTGHSFIRGNARHNLPPEEVTIAEVLKTADYATGLFGKWGLGQQGSPGIPQKQGFDEFLGYLDQHHAHNYFPAFLIRGDEKMPLKNVVPGEGEYGRGVAAEKAEYSPDTISAAALDFIAAHRERPFFLCFTPTLPHANNEAKQAGMEIPSYGQYSRNDWPEPQKGLAAMISRLDDDVGRILALLNRHNLDQQTLVLFSSDNGPHAEGGNNPRFFDSNGPLRGIKRDLYEGGIRVPMIARWPGRIAPKSVSEHVGSFADLLPTLAELAGAKPPESLDGVSFVPTLLRKPAGQKPHEFLYWEFYERGSAQAVRMGQWKAIARPLGGSQVELYDLSRDVGEEHDVAEANPEIVKQALERMKSAHQPSPLWTVPAKPATTPAR